MYRLLLNDLDYFCDGVILVEPFMSMSILCELIKQSSVFSR